MRQAIKSAIEKLDSCVGCDDTEPVDRQTVEKIMQALNDATYEYHVALPGDSCARTPGDRSLNRPEFTGDSNLWDANLSVLVAAWGVWLTHSGWPDIIVGLALAVLFLRSALFVLLESITELRSTDVSPRHQRGQ